MKDMKQQYEAPELTELPITDFVVNAGPSGGLDPAPDGENPFK